MAGELFPEQIKIIQDAIHAGNKIEAIKLYRTACGMDLKDAKHAVEELTRQLRQQNPAMFSKARKQNGALAALLFWGAAAAFVAYAVFRWA